MRSRTCAATSESARCDARVGTGSASEAPSHLPSHCIRSSLAVAPFFFRPCLASDRILHIFLARRRSGLHSNLFSVIHNRGSRQSRVQSRHDFRNLVVVLAISISIRGACDVVVADYKCGPARSSVQGCNLLAESRDDNWLTMVKTKSMGNCSWLFPLP